jgi:hypothetical protein
MKQKQKRGQLSQALWWLMWLSWFGLLVHQAADVERFAGTWALTGLRCLPLLCFLWAATRDSLKLFIWFDLILLFYFIPLLRPSLHIKLMDSLLRGSRWL